MKELAKSRFFEAEWIFNDRNGGFAYGMNQGLKKAKGEFLIISNPDAVIIEGFEKMIEFMNKHNEVGAIGPQLLDNDGNIQDNCRNYVSVQSFLFRQLRRSFRQIPVREKRLDHSLVQTVDWLAGAFIMIRREVLVRTGRFDEKYFMYAEDMDWCIRIREAGYEIVYYPMMRVLFSGSRRNREPGTYSKIFLLSHLKLWNKFGYFSGYPERKKIIYE